MSINPLDVVRTQEASQIKHMESQRTQHAQAQINQDFKEMVRQEQYKPTQATKSDNNEYRYDAKEKGNNQYQNLRDKKKNKDNKEKDKSEKPQNGGGIDLLI